MALSEQEEFELLSLERQRALQGQSSRPQIDNDAISQGARDAQVSPIRKGFESFLANNPVSLAAKGALAVNDAIDKGANYLGGKMTDKAAEMGASPENAALAGTLVNTGVQAIPMLAGGEVAKLAAPLMRKASESLMHSAVKPSTTLPLDDAKGIVNTMLNEGISASEGGARKLQGKINDISSQVTDLLAQHTGKTVDKNQVASRIQDTVSRIERTNPTPQDALRDVQKVYDEFLTNGIIPQNIPIADAQKFKSGLYKIIKDSNYGQISGNTVEAQKALARGFKEEIERHVPEVAGLNARERSLITARTAVERRTLVGLNNNPMGLAMLQSNPTGLAAMLADKSSWFKSTLARMLNAGKEQIPANTARIAIGLGTVDSQ